MRNQDVEPNDVYTDAMILIAIDFGEAGFIVLGFAA
jgi:hypothetical protein